MRTNRGARLGREAFKCSNREDEREDLGLSPDDVNLTTIGDAKFSHAGT